MSEGSSRFALGPLAEVAASTKTWSEMDPHLEHGPERMTFAAERVVRGETLEERIADLPSTLMGWEPSYPVATYKTDKVEAPSPKIPAVEEIELGEPGERIADPETEGALADLVQAWTEESNGRCETVAVEGSALSAVRALGLSRARVGPIGPREALQWMGWAAASGGAYGRRRGSAAGRYAAWWALSTIADLEWPVDPDDVERAVRALDWAWFDDGAPSTGWALRLAVADPTSGLAWAVTAVDAAD